MKAVVFMFVALLFAIPTAQASTKSGTPSGKSSVPAGCAPLDPAQAIALSGSIDPMNEGPGTGGSGGTYWGGPLIGSRCYPEEEGEWYLGHTGDGNPVVVICVCQGTMCLWASL